ncbi:TonB-dependent receptor plug domain-containing protein [Novosphingobium rhizosphaerae]|uniref:TonB-dependent receptor plug domain-containing protein n=1 Tax=Novosphingobium rhizosphaerae TaxID=1551649 RepID=UPI003D813CDF
MSKKDHGFTQTRKALLVGVALLGMIAVPSTSALAQQAKPADDDAKLNDTLAEIVVTAQRRTENLQDVPIAATSLNAEGLRDKAVTRLADLQFAAPSLSVTETGVVQQANIRGIGIASTQPSVANGVATYVNGLFQPPIVQNNSFFDIASIEVFRGPQGTLVGSNSTGGAIFINSQNPTLDGFNGYAGATYGNYDTAELIGAVNLPVSDTLAIRAAGQYRRHDSYYTDVGPFKNDAGKLDEKSARLSLLWKPGSFQALVKSEVFEMKTGGFAYRPIPGTPFAAGRVGGIRTSAITPPRSAPAGDDPQCRTQV